MRRIATLTLVSMFTTAALTTGCERNKDADKQAVEDIVAQRLEAEKAKAVADKNADLVKENAELKTKVQELEKRLAAIQANQARVAANSNARGKVQTEERKEQLKTLHTAITGAGGK